MGIEFAPPEAPPGGGPGRLRQRLDERAALLQLAHPYVAHAIEQNSEATRDPIGRFNRTFEAIYGIIIGDLDTAIAAAQRVRAIHERVNGSIPEDVGPYARGHRYHANDAGALLWVHATLVDTSVAAWADFAAYFARTTAGDDLAVGGAARSIARALMTPASAAMRPAMRWFASLTAGMLPPRIREGFGLPFERADRLAVEASLRALRRGWPLVPERLRWRPEYLEALRRLADGQIGHAPTCRWSGRPA